MRKRYVMVFTLWFMLFMSGLFLDENALACTEAVEINQVQALEGGVTTDDSPRFPVRINESGNYVLTSNLTVPENTDGIQIHAHDVSLNLNGFTISGRQGDAGCGMTSEFQRDTGTYEYDRITVHNGVVERFADDGINLGVQSVVEHVHSKHNGKNGISVSSGSRVIGNTAYRNGWSGIDTGHSSIVSDNMSIYSGRCGIDTEHSCTISGNKVRRNQSHGIQAQHSSTIIDNTAYRNRQDGFFIGLDSILRGNIATQNEQVGIYATEGSVVSGNLASYNSVGIRASLCTVSGNTAHGNESNGFKIYETSTLIGNTAVRNYNFGIYFLPDKVSGYNNNVVSKNNEGNSYPQIKNGHAMGDNICGTNTSCP